MTAPPLKGQKLKCANKRRYPCEFTARAAAMDSISRHRTVEALSVYRCKYCGGYHLTKSLNDVIITADNPEINKEDLWTTKAS